MQIKRWFQPPVFKDEEDTRIAAALNGILLILLIAALIAFPFLFSLQGPGTMIGWLYGSGTILISWALLRAGKVQLSSLFFLTVAVLLTAYFMLTGEGIHDTAIAALPLILIMAGTFLNFRAYLLLTAFVVLAANLVIYAEIRAWITPALHESTDYIDMVIVSGILITIALSVRMLANNLLESLRRTRQITREQANLILETRSQAEQLRILNQISLAVASGLDLDNMLEELYQQLKKVVPLDSFYVALIDHRLNLVTFPIFYSSGVRIHISAESLDAGSGLTGEVIRTQKTLYLPDVAEPAVQGEHEIITVGPGETRSYVGLPLYLHGDVFGVLSVQSQSPNAFIQEQLRLLETITSQVSVAIDNARLFVEIRETLKREERLNDVARVISGTLDLQFILEKVVQLAVELLDAEAGSLSLLSKDRHELSEVYEFNLPPETHQTPLRQGEGLTWWVIENCQSVSVREISQDPRANPALKDLGFHAAAGAPVLAGNECLGMISVLSKDLLKVFMERDVAVLEAIGRLAGSAIRNASLFAVLQQRDAILEAITYAAEQFLAASDWQSKMPEIIERLGREANVAQAFLLQVNPCTQEQVGVTLLFSWTSPDSPAVFDLNDPSDPALAQNPLQNWYTRMQEGKTYLGTSSKASPYRFDEAEDAFFKQRGIHSLISVPIFLNGEWWGAIGFADSEAGRDWLDVEVDALIVLTGLLSAAIQRQQATEALQEREALYRRAISAADAVPYYQDYTQDRYLFMGERISDLCGYTADEITPELWQSLIQEAVPIGESAGLDPQEVSAKSRSAKNLIWKCDFRIRTANGTTRWIADTSVEILGPDQIPHGSIGILQDITERKLAETALQESEERFRAIFENSATGIALGTLDGAILASNPSFRDLFGYSAAELHRRKFTDLLHPDDLVDEQDLIRRILSGEEDFLKVERCYRRKDGSKLWGRMTSSLIHDQDGTPRYGLFLVDDITEQKQILEALHQRDQILEAVAFAAGTFLKAADWRDVINTVLQRLCEEIGATHSYIYKAERSEDGHLLFTILYEYAVEAGYGDLEDPNFNQAPAENLGSKRWLYAMLRGEPYYGSVSSLPREDVELLRLFDVLAFLDTPILVGNEFWGLIGFEDRQKEREWSEAEIDSLKVAASVLSAAIQRQYSDEAVRKLNAELEQRVLERTAELQTANRELESFAYSVSHDLRTPLRGIDGYSRLLLEDYSSLLDEQGRQYLENVRRATSQMSQLINDLLLLSRVARAEMHREVVDLAGIAREVVENLRQIQPDRSIEIDIQLDMPVYGDANLLKLALENLINNAWKFTSRNPTPRIEIGCTQQKGHPIYFVRDNGVGFEMKYKDKLFTVFQRLHSAEEFEGTGVGLATVQRVIQRHSGQIWAESQVNQGAVFYFTLFDPAFSEESISQAEPVH